MRVLESLSSLLDWYYEREKQRATESGRLLRKQALDETARSRSRDRDSIIRLVRLMCGTLETAPIKVDE